MKFRRFNSLDRPPERRLEYWNELSSAFVPGMTVDGDRALRAFWNQGMLGDIAINETGSQGAIARLKADRRHDELRHVGFAIQVAGSSCLSQRSNTAILRPGDMTLSALGQHQEFKVSDGSRMFGVGLSAADLGLSDGRLHGLIGVAIPGNRPFVTVLRDFLVGLCRQPWIETPTEDETQALRAVLLRLARLCVEGDRKPQATSIITVHELIVGFVDSQLFATGLGTGMIADRLSLSPRTVQNIFARMGTTPTAYIAERRLMAAANILRGGQDFGSITELAYDIGFSDASYFTRCFKARFGVSPLRYRREAADGTDVIIVKGGS